MKIHVLKFLPIIYFCLSLYGSAIFAASAPVTLFAPGQPETEKTQKLKKNNNPGTPDGTDILISLIEPYEYEAYEMERPQILGMYHYGPFAKPSPGEPEFIDLLSDMEEIRYMNKKAWTVNIANNNPGLYQLILETRPWWDARRNIFIQHQGKLLLPVLGIDDGWNIPTGQSLEIVPLTNPFGLVAPAFFAAKLLIDGKPAANMEIIMGSLNTKKESVPTRWHEAMEARSDANGQFGFVLNKAGWWYCEARIPGAPLKGPDGEARGLLRSTLLWVYVSGDNIIKKNKK